MRNTLLTLLFFLFLLNARSQSIYNFFTDGARWEYYTPESTDGTTQFVRFIETEDSLVGDTVINSITYKKHYSLTKTSLRNLTTGQISSAFVIPPVDYLRFDSLTNRVYYFSDTSTAEIVLYDFTLNSADTLPFVFTSVPDLRIDSVNSINVSGFTLQRYNYSGDVNYPFIPGENYIIQGIGGYNGLISFQPVYAALSAGIWTTTLTCFQNDSVLFTQGGSTACNNLINEIPNAGELVLAKAYPNPTNGDFKISLPEGKEVLMELFSTDGKLIEQKNIDSKSVMSITESGSYIWRITTATGSKSGVVIKR